MPKIIFRPNPTPPPFPPPIPPTPVWPYVDSPGFEAYFPTDGVISIQRIYYDDPSNITKSAILLFKDKVFVEEIPCTYKSISSEDITFSFDAALTSRVQAALNNQSVNFVFFYADGTTEQFYLEGS